MFTASCEGGQGPHSFTEPDKMRRPLMEIKPEPYPLSPKTILSAIESPLFDLTID